MICRVHIRPFTQLNKLFISNSLWKVQVPHLGKGLASFRFWKSDYKAFLWVSVGKRSITPCIQIFVCFLYIYSLAFFPSLALLARSWQSFRGGARILQKGLCSQRYVSFIWTVRNSPLMGLDTDTDMQTTHVKYILLWIPGTGFFMGGFMQVFISTF